MEEKGSKLLKISSILMIIGGIVGAIGSVLLAVLSIAASKVINDAEFEAAMAEAGTNAGTVTTVFWIATVITVVCSIVEIIAGVLGKKNWNNPAKATTLLVWGIIVAVVSLGSNIAFAGQNGVSVLSIVTGVAIPVLYIIGTIQLKKQGAE